MLKISKFAVLAMSGALVINSAYAEDKSLALVNGVSIPQSRVEIRVKAAIAQGQADSPELRKAIREDMINLEVMAQEADKSGLNKNSEVQQQIDLTKQSVLASALVQNYVKSHPVTDEQLKQEYENRKRHQIRQTGLRKIAGYRLCIKRRITRLGCTRQLRSSFCQRVTNAKEG